MLRGLVLSVLSAASFAAMGAEFAPINFSAVISSDSRSIQFYVKNDLDRPVYCKTLAIFASYVKADGSSLGTINYRVVKQAVFPSQERFIDPEITTAAQQMLAANPGARISALTQPQADCQEWTSIELEKPFWMSSQTFKVLKRYSTHEAILENMTPHSVMFNCDTRITADQCETIKMKAREKRCTSDEFNNFLRSVPNFSSFGVIPTCSVYRDEATQETFPYVEYFCPCDNPE